MVYDLRVLPGAHDLSSTHELGEDTLLLQVQRARHGRAGRQLNVHRPPSSAYPDPRKRHVRDLPRLFRGPSPHHLSA